MAVQLLDPLERQGCGKTDARLRCRRRRARPRPARARRPEGRAGRGGHHGRWPAGRHRGRPGGPGPGGRGRRGWRRPPPPPDRARPGARCRLRASWRRTRSGSLPGSSSVRRRARSASARSGSRAPSMAATASAVGARPSSRAARAMCARRGCSGSSAMARPWAVIAPSGARAPSSSSRPRGLRERPRGRLGGQAQPGRVGEPPGGELQRQGRQVGLLDLGRSVGGHAALGLRRPQAVAQAGPEPARRGRRAGRPRRG